MKKLVALLLAAMMLFAVSAVQNEMSSLKTS